MAIGDEIGLTEETYRNIIADQTAAIAVLNQRIRVKDAAIAEKDAKIKELEEKLAAEPVASKK